MAGEPVSRILSPRGRRSDSHQNDLGRATAIIPLGLESLRDSSSLPEVRAPRCSTQGAYGPGQPSPPIWPCSTRGFPCPGCCHPGGGLLPHLFTLAKCARPNEASFRFFRKACRRGQSLTGGLFSVALSVAAASELAFAHPERSPLALPGALPCRGRLLRAGHGWSPDFPPACSWFALPRTESQPAIARPIRLLNYTMKSAGFCGADRSAAFSEGSCRGRGSRQLQASMRSFSNHGRHGGRCSKSDFSAARNRRLDVA